jgi:cytochrome c oxidase cbb3-type subunit 3
MSAQDNAKDPVSGYSTTGHEWDGIRELNAPLPRWWLWLFYATIVWGVVYWIAYPSWPLVSSYTRGVLGWQSRDAIETDMKALQDMRGANIAKLASATPAEIIADPKLLQTAQAAGKAAFGTNCAPCHGSGGAGAKGFPNLVDDQWMWGGKPDQIHQTIQYGIRNTNEQSRQGNMPAFGKDGIIPKEDIPSVAAYVMTLTGHKAEGKVDLEKGAKLFAENCAACHGEQGKGNAEVGAPNLTSNIWLYGGDQKTIEETITNGRGGVMPAWGERLDPATVNALAVYVHTLGGGQ